MKDPLRSSPLVEELRTSSDLRVGSTTVAIAGQFGFCSGVRRALRTVDKRNLRAKPGIRCLLLHEIIHNPTVCMWLEEQGFVLVEPHEEGWWKKLRTTDTVIVSAFGATVEQEKRLEEAGVRIVETTCPSVRQVWKRVSSYAVHGFTTVLHGKKDHPETEATLSHAVSQGGHFVVIRDLNEAARLARIIEGKSSNADRSWIASVSDISFEYPRDIQRIGLANQTTMVATESLQVEEMLKSAMVNRFGADHVRENFRAFGTICRATQQRQDAARELAKTQPDLMIVVGGHNSSNTRHLAEVSTEWAPVLHIEGPEAIQSLDDIIHLPVGRETTEHISLTWLEKKSDRRLGFTGGASTPDAELGGTIATLLMMVEPVLPEIVMNELLLSGRNPAT